MNPSCLKVERAIIFLKSVSNIALRAEINIVKLEIKAITKIVSLLSKITVKNRIIKYTPAVTSVEEWTSAETGVGAAIAAGSHLINGNCALLVKHPIKRKILRKIEWTKKVDPKEKKRPIERIKHKSPTRFKNIVIILAPKDLEFW